MAIAERIPGVLGLVDRVRVMGSLALSLCHLADGRVDAVCSLKEARSVDIAAAQLLVRECGFAIELFDDPPFRRLRSISPLALASPRRHAGAGGRSRCSTALVAWRKTGVRSREFPPRETLEAVRFAAGRAAPPISAPGTLGA